MTAEMIEYNNYYVVAYTKIVRKLPSCFTLNPDYAKQLDANFKATIVNDRVVFIGTDRRASIVCMRSDVEL